MKNFAMASLAILAFAAPVAGSAHHSPVAVYDMESRVNKVGTIAKINWVNPHIYVDVVVMENGKPVTWAMESMPPSYFARAGVRKKDFDARVGQKVTARVMTARNGKPLGFLRDLGFEDGTHIRILADNETATR